MRTNRSAVAQNGRQLVPDELLDSPHISREDQMYGPIEADIIVPITKALQALAGDACIWVLQEKNSRAKGQTAFQVGNLKEKKHPMEDALGFIETHKETLKGQPWRQLVPDELLGSSHISCKDQMYGPIEADIIVPKTKALQAVAC